MEPTPESISPAPSPPAAPQAKGYAKREPRDVRRKQILDAALPEFMEKGFTGTHIDTIAEQVGVSKPVIYSIFPGKGSLSAAVVEEAHRQEAVLNIEADNLEGYSKVGEGEVIPLFKTAFRIAAENPQLMCFLYSDFRGAPREAIEFHDEVFDLRTGGLEWHLEQFFAGRAAAAQLTKVGAKVISSVGRTGILEIACGKGTDPETLADLYGGVVERGIRSD